jgi:hypothetical protein
VGKELNHLANELPKYRHNIQERVNAVRNASEGGTISRLRAMAADISTSALDASAGPPAPSHTRQADAPPSEPRPAFPPPEPDPVQSSGGMASTMLDSTLAALANGLGVAAVVIVLVIFMLLRQEDVSHRLVSLVGFSRLTTTTKAIDEIGDRISRYLLMLATVNSLYGVMLAVGLAVIGLPYVLLWGVLAALFRFIPYVGPWIVAVLPMALSLAVFDGWTQPLMVMGLIIILELGTNMILEPKLYGHSVGVSDLALLITITFWTWLWGGIGLVLATPLTVCILVLCKYLPNMAWVDILLGDKQTPQSHLTAFQRLVAGDEEAYQATLEDCVKEQGVAGTLDSLALPALVLARRETVLGRLDQEEQDEVYETLQSTTHYLRACRDQEREEAIKQHEKALKKAAKKGEATPEPSLLAEETPTEEAASHAEPPSPEEKTFSVYARALNGRADVQALEMLETLLPSTVILEVSDGEKLVGELVSELNAKKPSLFIISAMRPGSLLAAETLCRRLHHQLPAMKILVCRWSLPGQQPTTKSLKDSGATWVVATLNEAYAVIEEVTML